MNDVITGLILLALALVGVVLRKTYYSLPPLELKRRAEKGYQPEAQLYRAAAYGNSLRTLLWLFIGLTAAASFVMLARELPVWLSLVIIGPLLWVVFSLLPSTRVTGLGIWLASLATPVIAWVLNYLHPLLSRSADAVEHRYLASKHTGLYEREDLVELIEQQQRQEDNRLSDEELEIAKRALSFDEYKVRDILTSRKKVKTVLADDTVGPILIDELHKSGLPYVLVKESPKGDIVGTLSFNKLGIRSEGKVRDLMYPTVYYLHENDSLAEALHAFFMTNCPVFVVVNGFEEYAGIVTVESMMRQLLGHIPGDEFDQYADRAAVAGRHAKPRNLDDKKEKKEAEPEETPVKTDAEVVE
jgi:CBS domain containing-hemolysin-like protein